MVAIRYCHGYHIPIFLLNKFVYNLYKSAKHICQAKSQYVSNDTKKEELKSPTQTHIRTTTSDFVNNGKPPISVRFLKLAYFDENKTGNFAKKFSQFYGFSFFCLKKNVKLKRQLNYRNFNIQMKRINESNKIYVASTKNCMHTL